MRDSKGRFIKGHEIWLGKHLTQEHKDKLSNAHKGKVVSVTVRKKISIAQTGKQYALGKTWKVSSEALARMAANRKPRIFSEEHRKNLSKALKGRKVWWVPKGEKAYNWKGGKTSQAQLIRNSPEYKRWREAVFKRDDYRCFDCGIKNEPGLGKTIVLNADHIYPFAHFPRLHFELENGQTLCEDCHRKTNTFGVKANQSTNLLVLGWLEISVHN